LQNITQALGLMKGIQAQSVFADKGYDANDFVSFIREQQICAYSHLKTLIIAPRKTTQSH
jgi:hypothetical protein